MTDKSKPLPATTPEEHQRNLLEESKKRVDAEGFLMKRGLDNGKLMDSLRHASNMIGELRTSMLTPQNYYELFIQASGHLQYLQGHLMEEIGKGEKISRLYELVQYAGNILPRLYLLVTVGGVYIKSKEAPAKDILHDMVEMCKGVQHPTRGLFLRYYLSETTKDKLPDVGTDYYGDGGRVNDCVEFIIQNFIEMNKLWVRIQHQPLTGNQDKNQREKEREQLRLLVGTTLSRLSRLDGVDAACYQNDVLPRILEQIISCKDQIAQQYLMDCIIQAFPDEFHIQTLDELLKATTQLVPGVKVPKIVVSLVQRFANYFSMPENPKNPQVFEVLFSFLENITESSPNTTTTDVIELYISLVGLSLGCEPDNLSKINKIFGDMATILKKIKDQGEILNNTTNKAIVQLLRAPTEKYPHLLDIILMENFSVLLNSLSYTHRKNYSLEVAKLLNVGKIPIASREHVEKILAVLSTLFTKQPDTPSLDDFDLESFEEELHHVASLVHLMTSDELPELVAMFKTARTLFNTPGLPSIKARYLHQPIIFRSLQIATSFKSDEPNVYRGIFKFVIETINMIKTPSCDSVDAELALKLFLQSAMCANNCQREDIAYEFISQAFTVFEEQISDTKEQFRLIQLFTNTLKATSVFQEENFETLVRKIVLYSKRLIKQHEQCKAISFCAHLFWSPNNPAMDSARVEECLRRAYKIASESMEPDVAVMTDILNQYIYFFLNNVQEITPQHITQIIREINDEIAKLDSPATSEGAQLFQKTISYLQFLGSQQANLSRPVTQIEF